MIDLVFSVKSPFDVRYSTLRLWVGVLRRRVVVSVRVFKDPSIISIGLDAFNRSERIVNLTLVLFHRGIEITAHGIGNK